MISCLKCKQEIHPRGFLVHFSSCDGYGTRRKKYTEHLNVSYCKFCKKEFTRKSIGGHTINCKLNPTREDRYLSLKKKRKPLSDNHKYNLSIAQSNFLESNPDKVPFILNHSSKISYPELYFIECFKKYENIIFQHKVSRYKLDFANISKKLYLEIDGEQHFNNKMIEHDIRRTEKLLELGWTGIRIRWSEFQKCSEEEKCKKVEEMIQKMK